jgi:hypothetical protein
MLSYFRDREWLVHDRVCSGLSLEKAMNWAVRERLEMSGRSGNARPE